MKLKTPIKWIAKTIALPFTCAYKDISNAVGGARNRGKYTFYSTRTMLQNAVNGKFAKSENLAEMENGRLRDLLIINFVQGAGYIAAMCLFLHITLTYTSLAVLPYAAMSLGVYGCIRDFSRLYNERRSRVSLAGAVS